jgi:hypothetical protein
MTKAGYLVSMGGGNGNGGNSKGNTYGNSLFLDLTLERTLNTLTYGSNSGQEL